MNCRCYKELIELLGDVTFYNDREDHIYSIDMDDMTISKNDSNTHWKTMVSCSCYFVMMDEALLCRFINTELIDKYNRSIIKTDEPLYKLIMKIFYPDQPHIGTLRCKHSNTMDFTNYTQMMSQTCRDILPFTYEDCFESSCDEYGPSDFCVLREDYENHRLRAVDLNEILSNTLLETSKFRFTKENNEQEVVLLNEQGNAGSTNIIMYDENDVRYVVKEVLWKNIFHRLIDVIELTIFILSCYDGIDSKLTMELLFKSVPRRIFEYVNERLTLETAKYRPVPCDDFKLMQECRIRICEMCMESYKPISDKIGICMERTIVRGG